MISPLTKTLIREGSPYYNYLFLVGIGVIMYGFWHSPIRAHQKKMKEQAKTIFVWYPKARIDLKIIHDENDVLTDDELATARNILKKSKQAFLYIQNEFPRGFSLLNHVWGDLLIELKKDSLNALIISEKVQNVRCYRHYWCSHLKTLIVRLLTVGSLNTFLVFCLCFRGRFLWSRQRWLLINDNLAVHFLLTFSKFFA